MTIGRCCLAPRTQPLEPAVSRETGVDPRSRGDARVGGDARRRIYQLDAIRGLLAIGVAVYHVEPGPATAILGTWGVYAFFVLSGWAMEHVYGASIDVRRFAIARVARLAPLWIPVVLVSAFAYGTADPGRILLNVTGAFGFASPGATSIPTGGWSIGIELACYVLFAALTLWRLSTRELAIAAAAGIALRFVTVGGLMPADLTASWVAYTVPTSFVGFFLVGMLAARTVRLPTWSGRRARVASWLGDASYGTYLLHPLIAILVGPATVILTPPLAWLIHRLYEAPTRRAIVRLGDLQRVQLRRVVPARLAAVPEDADGVVGRSTGLELHGRR